MKQSNNKILFNFMLCFLGFSIPMGGFLSLLFGLPILGILLGIAGGLLFAIMMIGFLLILSSKKNKLKEMYGIQEDSFYDGAANYMVGKDAIGGWIFLFDEQFCFFPH